MTDTPKKRGRPTLPCASCGSMQPKRRGRCVDCEARVARTPAKTDANNGWISVSRKVPKNTDSVMALTSDGKQLSAWRSAMGNWVSEETQHYLKVTHWRKLHRPPQP